MNARLIFSAIVIATINAMMPPPSTAQDKLGENVSDEATFETTHIALYNSIPEFESRSAPAAVIAPFIKQVQAKAAELWSDKEPETGKNGLIAVAIRPGGTMKFWVDIDRKHQPKLSDALGAKMQPVGVPQVQGGPVAFSINFHLWGGADEPNTGVKSVELPEVWRIAGQKSESSLKVPDDFLPLVWKPKPGEAVDEATFVPEGFVSRELKPIGGRILCPKDWFYTERHRKNVLMWTIAKENQPDGGYETGVRIQFIVGIKKLTGQAASSFVKAFLEGKKKSSKVIRDCPETKQGSFTRVCLETESLVDPDDPDQETPSFRILYSCFWSDEMDMAVVSIAGTTPELWDRYEQTFDTMAAFQLLDMNQIGK